MDHSIARNVSISLIIASDKVRKARKILARQGEIQPTKSRTKGRPVEVIFSVSKFVLSKFAPKLFKIGNLSPESIFISVESIERTEEDEPVWEACFAFIGQKSVRIINREKPPVGVSDITVKCDENLSVIGEDYGFKCAICPRLMSIKAEEEKTTRYYHTKGSALTRICPEHIEDGFEQVREEDTHRIVTFVTFKWSEELDGYVMDEMKEKKQQYHRKKSKIEN